jgi:hypothetical protein
MPIEAGILSLPEAEADPYILNGHAEFLAAVRETAG